VARLERRVAAHVQAGPRAEVHEHALEPRRAVDGVDAAVAADERRAKQRAPAHLGEPVDVHPRRGARELEPVYVRVAQHGARRGQREPALQHRPRLPGAGDGDLLGRRERPGDGDRAELDRVPVDRVGERLAGARPARAARAIDADAERRRGLGARRRRTDREASGDHGPSQHRREG
jgi:hypothetical protein